MVSLYSSLEDNPQYISTALLTLASDHGGPAHLL